MTAHALTSIYAVVDLYGRKREQAQTRRRTCAHEGCDTILSRYGDGTFCALHEPPEAEYVDPSGHRPGHKLCCRCFKRLPLDEFRQDASRSDGHKSICKACDSSEARRRYASDPAYRERVRAKQARHSARRSEMRRAKRERKASLRRDGRPDAVQRAQRGDSA